MKCVHCAQENKDTAKVCKKCGQELALLPAWFPDWKWHGRTLAVIYACVTALYIGATVVLKRLPQPYHIRKIPPEMTPWLRK